MVCHGRAVVGHYHVGHFKVLLVQAWFVLIHAGHHQLCLNLAEPHAGHAWFNHFKLCPTSTNLNQFKKTLNQQF
jgi:hypothetical protein